MIQLHNLLTSVTFSGFSVMCVDVMSVRLRQHLLNTEPAASPASLHWEIKKHNRDMKTLQKDHKDKQRDFDCTKMKNYNWETQN